MAPTKASAIRLRYTNRKSAGEKLAEIVAKDIRKPTTVFHRKTEITDNDSAVLEIDLDDKSQTDSCINIIVPATLGALSCREGISAARLEELSLRNNSITSASLRALAPVIKAACFEIRDVDLSYNRIQVKTEEEAADFEVFLDAFAECEVMRRLDLSGNDFSGPFAFEIFLRVYCRHQPVDGSLQYYENKAGHRGIDNNDSNHSNGQPPISLRLDSGNEIDSSISLDCSMTNRKVLQRRRGLRAIPYIILKKTSLTDSGALHLSYALERHYLPQYLLTKLKEGSREAKRQEEDDSDGSFGIAYHDNAELSVYGTKLLDLANAARIQLISSDTPGNDPQGSWDDAMAVSTDKLQLPVRPRKSSLQSISDISNTERRHGAPTVDIHSLRLRLQRATLEDISEHGVQLWRIALKILFAARVILPHKQAVDGAILKHTSKMTADSVSADQCDMTIAKNASEPTLPTISSFSRQAVGQLPKQASLLSLQTNGRMTSTKLTEPNFTDTGKFRDVRNPGQLPISIWSRILVKYAHRENILDQDQLDSIVRYAQDRSNIAAERQNQAKGESHQLWHVLDKMDCFTYVYRTASYKELDEYDTPQNSGRSFET